MRRGTRFVSGLMACGLAFALAVAEISAAAQPRSAPALRKTAYSPTQRHADRVAAPAAAQLQYIRSESILELERDGSAIAGRLSAGGRAVAGAVVELAALDVGARTGPQPRRSAGIVPPDAASAILGLRVDTEGACVCAGPAGAIVGGLRYTEPVTGLRQELSPVKLPIDDAPASYRTLELLPGRSFAPDLGQFNVNSGAAYLLQAPIAATANASRAGYVALIFLDAAGKEIRRDRLWFEPASKSFDSVTTDADGRFRLDLPELLAGYDPQVRASYAGSLELRAAEALLPASAPDAILPALAQRVPDAAQLQGRKLVWFAPREDFFGRLVQGESWSALEPQWREAAGHVQIIKLNPVTLSAIPDAALPRILRQLDQRGLALGLEIQPLNRYNELPCGGGVEGYSDPGGANQVIDKLLRAGGRLSAITLDEPLWYGHYWSGKNACASSVYDVARRAAGIIKIYTAAFPNLIVGDTEPFPELSAQPNWEADYATWVQAFRSASGTPLAFMHLDFNWGNPRLSLLFLMNDKGDASAIAELARRVAPPLRAQGLQLGMICNGNNGASSDEQWVQQAQAHIDAIEASGIRPEQLLFETWAHAPARTIPESDPATLAGLVVDYFRRYP